MIPEGRLGFCGTTDTIWANLFDFNDLISCPSIKILPESGEYTPLMSRISVVFPDPLGPTTPIMSFDSNSILIPSIILWFL